jgi:MinD-like ATPase involved in chromosome partitioning or flagellar assembly
MRPDVHAPRIVVASGMAGTGVSTVAAEMQSAAPALNVVEAGARWTDIIEACMPGFARMIVVTTHDLVAVSSTYALIKLVRDRFPDARVEVLVNRSGAREALRTYERVQGAASHFLGETVGYAGSVPDAALDTEHGGAERPERRDGTPLGRAAVMALDDLATRLDEELTQTVGRGVLRPGERRMAL